MPAPHEFEKTRPAESGAPPGSSLPEDELPLRKSRVHITARQRGADVTALSSLALHLPHVLASLTVVLATSYVFAALGGPPWWIPSGGWVLSGALAFHRACE